MKILAADELFYDGDCSEVIIPGVDGLYGIQPDHSNMIMAIIPGALTFKIPGQPERIAAVSEGLVKVENNDVLIIVDSAERPEDIDINRARRAADEAREMILQKRSRLEYRAAEARLARALNRLSIKENYNIKP